MSFLRFVGISAAAALLLQPLSAQANIGSAINSVFLHINNVAVDCDDYHGRRLPYNDALIECAHDERCCFVLVEETDVHREEHGMCRLCSSCMLQNARAMENGRISIKGHRIFGKSTRGYDVTLNTQGICERDQLLGTLSPVVSFATAASGFFTSYRHTVRLEECERTNCDYFTLATLEGYVWPASPVGVSSLSVVDYPGNVNKAWFCSGSPSRVPMEGFITAVRKKRRTEL